MRINRSLSVTLCRVSAVALFVASSAAMLDAQQTMTVAELHQPALFNPASSPSLDLVPNLANADGIGYSSSVGSDSTVSPDALTFSSSSTGDATQPPPRRRYGRPNYSDRMHNSDGSSKITILAGVGFTNPMSDSTNYLKTGWKIQAGVGYNFNKKLGVVFQFDWDHFALPGQVISNQSNVYDSYFGYSGSVPGLDGNAHIWSFTLNPTYNFYQSDTTGVYAVVGGGFYHKVTDFTLPATGQYCSYYGCYQYTANQTFDQYVSNSPGVSAGLGFTWKMSRFASQRLYAEARYVHTFNSYRPLNFSTTVLYPGNSTESSYVPVTVGVRF